jgi:class 3 adenylate cyclase
MTFSRGSLRIEEGQHRRFEHGIGTVTELGSMILGRAELEPGWRWSNDVKPIVGTEWCEVHHLHILLRGQFAVQKRDGETAEFGPLDVFDVPPGHDAWVVGNEIAELIDISGNSMDFALAAPMTRVLATMLMTDIVGSTETASRVGDQAWKQMLGEHDRITRSVLERFHGREIKSTGDGFLATFDSAANALNCAVYLTRALSDSGITIRAGIHTGELEMRGGDIHGVAVHAVARIMASAGPGQVVASGISRAVAFSRDLRFESLGEQSFKGIDHPIETYLVSAGEPADLRA